MVRYGCLFIDGVKVIVGTDGSCNHKRLVTNYGNSKYKGYSYCYSIKINGKRYKLHRIMANLFLDERVQLERENEETLNFDYNHRVVFKNNNPLDLRIENIEIITQSESLYRNKRNEDNKIYLINLKGEIVDEGYMSELKLRNNINQGCINDVLVGNNRYLTSPIHKGKLIAVRGKDLNEKYINEKIKKAKDKIIYKRRKKVLKVDRNGDSIMKDVSEVRNTVNGLHMACSGKRNTADGFVWIYEEDYINDPDILMERVNKALSNTRSNNSFKSF